MADRMATFKYARNKGCTIPGTFLDSELVTYGDVKNNNTVKIDNASRYTDKRCVREIDLSMQDVEASITLGYSSKTIVSGGTVDEILTYTTKNVSGITATSSNTDWLTIGSYDGAKCVYTISQNTGKSSRSATITVKGKNSVTGEDVTSSCVISQNGASYTYTLAFKRNDGGNLNYENKVTIDGNVNTFAASANSYTFTAATSSVTISSSANYFTNNYSTSTSINYGNTTITYTPMTYYFYGKVVDENGIRITGSTLVLDYEYTNLVDGGKHTGKKTITNGYFKQTETGATSMDVKVTGSTNPIYIVPSSSVNISGKSTEPTSYIEIPLSQQSLDVTYKVKLQPDINFVITSQYTGNVVTQSTFTMWLNDGTKDGSIQSDAINYNGTPEWESMGGPIYKGTFETTLGTALVAEFNAPAGGAKLNLYIELDSYGWSIAGNPRSYAASSAISSILEIDGKKYGMTPVGTAQYKAELDLKEGLNEISYIELSGHLQ